MTRPTGHWENLIEVLQRRAKDVEATQKAERASGTFSSGLE